LRVPIETLGAFIAEAPALRLDWDPILRVNDCSCLGPSGRLYAAVRVTPSHSSEGTSGHFSGALDTNPPLTTAEGEETIVEVPLEFLPLAGLRIGDRVRVSNAGLKLLLRRG
jgi:hypothetical protein